MSADNPPPPEVTGEFYLTPALEKRPDHLCPQLLDPNYTSCMSDDNGGVWFSRTTAMYRTNSKFLNRSVQKLNDDSLELEFITGSIMEFLRDLGMNDDNIIGMEFFAEGCTWVLELNPKLGTPNYQIHVSCFARREEDTNTTTFIVATSLFDKEEKSLASSSLPGFKDAKDTFDLTALTVRKAVVKCEFPTFPEGLRVIPESGEAKLFKEVYKLRSMISRGEKSTIARGTHRASEKMVAVKAILRTNLSPQDDASIYDEVSMMAALSKADTSYHVLPLIDFFEEEDKYYIIMELMGGGDLLERISKIEQYTEADVREIVDNILQAMAHCHAQNIAYRDMNPKNILLKSEEGWYVKLTHFRLAARCYEEMSLTKQCGTPCFTAPEVILRRPYDQRADMWSVGCIAFLLLSGQLPFQASNQKELFRKIVSAEFDFDVEAWANISQEGKNFLNELLLLNADERFTAEEARNHSWMLMPRKRLQNIDLTEAAKRIAKFNGKLKSTYSIDENEKLVEERRTVEEG
ncbi:serine/threonine protein kinase [Nitzschia inconspicua]|uniref:Serine/threonine protein kinase n=1 Tax=Nitzschia inconspicua TaxID=303405 RepID=A0A9K3KLU3_9STRA|nr:serine/threonine protein kinase [Nitzschia inconspicua]